MKGLNRSLDYYGKPGTIAEIKLTDTCIFIREYNANGQMEEPIPVPLKRKKEVLDVYFRDLLGYLNVNQSKVNTYLNTRLKKKLNLKNLYIETFVSGAISVIGVGLMIASTKIMSFDWTAIISFLIFISSGSYCGVKLFEKYKYNKDYKKAQYIEYYKEYQNELNEYHISNDKEHTPTKYQKLSKGNVSGNTLKKTRILEK